MSVLIRCMEMPKSCFECRFSIDGFCYASGLVNIRANDERQITNWCPLVPVPEHGRLIDADAALKSEQPPNVTDEQWAQTTLAKCIVNAPTIIPAEEGEG